ncbi:MAG TPA: hypothetical protein VFE11_12185, partial [Dongiaceae bacterium]|nr:hypothetical protein [Dongiaceae bacterium]
MTKVTALAGEPTKQPHERAASKGKRRIIPLDLESAVANLECGANVVIRVEDVPVGVTLSAGSGASGSTNADNADVAHVWSLRTDELEDLHLLAPANFKQDCTLTIRILLPDPDGYDYATTLAKFDVLVTAAGAISPFSALQKEDRKGETASLVQLRDLIGRKGGKAEAKSAKRSLNFLDGENSRAPDEQRATTVLQQLLDEEDRRDAEKQRIAEAEAEWRVQEERRLRVARAEWEKETELQVAAALEKARAEEAQRQAQAELLFQEKLAERAMTVETRWKVKELRQSLPRGGKGAAAANEPPATGASEAAIEARLKAELADKLKAAEARWQAAEAERLAAARSQWEAAHKAASDQAAGAANDRVAASEAQLKVALAEQLKAAESRWQAAEAERLAAARSEWEAAH